MIQAVIFDMDGVISDTQKLHSLVESKLLQRYGIEISPEEITQKYSGVRTKDFFDELLQKQQLEYDLNALMDEKWKEMEKYAQKSVDAIDGAVNLIKQLSQSQYPLAVASASNLNYVTTVLKSLEIIDYFSYIVSGDMVSKGKPDPESFLLASKKIDVPPENCLVIEDGISGMQAAKDGNMKCVGLVKDITKSYPTRNIITSLSQITPKYISQLIDLK